MWTLLILLGVPVGAGGGMLLAGWRSRRRFAAAEGVFRCKVRARGIRLGGLAAGWSRRATRARWQHDVLLVHRGLLFPRTVPLAVRKVEGAVRNARYREVGRLDAAPLLITLRLDDGMSVEVAAPAADRAALAGPYLAAAIPGLPPARTERPG